MSTTIQAQRDDRCPRCGNVAAAGGHTLLGEWQECLDAFRFGQQLSRWALNWKPTSTKQPVTATATTQDERR